MSDDLSLLVLKIKRLDLKSKQEIFEAIKNEITVHPLEKRFCISAQIILEAISRAGDLTQRGVRGVIAETVFAMDVASQAAGWSNDTPPGDHPYDVRLLRQSKHARIQVKLQRRTRGEPLMRSKIRGGDKTHYVVEVQRTRGGARNGERTRPYRYDEFDLIAVCMQPSTGNWHDFLYAPVMSLTPQRDRLNRETSSPHKNSIIDTMQFVPAFPATDDPSG